MNHHFFTSERNIFFYEISTLNLIREISYCSRLNRLALLNETYLLVNSISEVQIDLT